MGWMVLIMEIGDKSPDILRITAKNEDKDRNFWTNEGTVLFMSEGCCFGEHAEMDAIVELWNNRNVVGKNYYLPAIDILAPTCSTWS